MKNTNIQTLKGFRDFLPQEKRQRNFVQSKIVEVFEKFGFEPLETPTLESADLLLGKYGAEADKLVFNFEDRGGRQIGLRYDQTVPTARVLAQYQNELPKYFRRYQIQNTFRAEKPQKGRYREFTQCDIDIFGSQSPVADAEIIACTYFSFANVGFKNIKLKINDRQVLFETLSPFATNQVSVLSIIQTIDKLDKLESTQVIQELIAKGVQSSQAQKILIAIAQAQISENLQAIIQAVVDLGVPKSAIEFSPSLARGLDYYTGMIFEVSLADYSAGSCGGGGRYDNLINQLGGIDIPAVGIAFGFDRMVEAANQLNLIPMETEGTSVLVTIFDQNLQNLSLQTANYLRNKGIKTEVFPSIEKLNKQLKYANQKNIPWVIMIGDQEAQAQQITLKNMNSGEQEKLSIDQAVEKISK